MLWNAVKDTTLSVLTFMIILVFPVTWLDASWGPACYEGQDYGIYFIQETCVTSWSKLRHSFLSSSRNEVLLGSGNLKVPKEVETVSEAVNFKINPHMIKWNLKYRNRRMLWSVVKDTTLWVLVNGGHFDVTSYVAWCKLRHSVVSYPSTHSVINLISHWISPYPGKFPTMLSSSLVPNRIKYHISCLYLSEI